MHARALRFSARCIYYNMYAPFTPCTPTSSALTEVDVKNLLVKHFQNSLDSCEHCTVMHFKIEINHLIIITIIIITVN